MEDKETLKPFDSHAHLDNAWYDEDRESVIEEAYQQVSGIINPACDMPTAKFALELAHKWTNIYAAVGFHPHEARHFLEKDLIEQAEMAKNSNVVAVGEIGLDYYYDHSPRDVQREVFIRHLDLARQLHLPIIIHDRDAHGDMMEIIKKEGKGLRGVFHCFSGSNEMATELLKMDFYLAFGGSLTFKNAVKTVAVIKNMPMDRVLLETDAPYLAPEPNRGKRNIPSYIQLVAEKVVAEKNLTYVEVIQQTNRNVQELFTRVHKV